MAHSEEFRRLLTEAVYRISTYESDKPIRVVQDELGYALNKRGGGSTIEYWRQGHLPKMTDVAALARLIIQRSDLDQDWLAQFLQSANYPHAQALCGVLFPSDASAQSAPAASAVAPTEPPASPLIFLPNKSYRTLVGREPLVSEALAALQDRQGRWIVTIDGMGGIGKTALAREVVAQALKLQLFERAVWVSAAADSDLGSFTAPRAGTAEQHHTMLTLDGVFNTIALQLGLPGLTQLSETEKAWRIQLLLRRQRLLVVLDNLETAAQPQALLVDRLYTMLNPSKALCTSRQRFLGNVYAIHLDGLREPAATQFIREEAQERRLFSLATAPDEVMTQISITTGGSPLALKLVVGQLGYLPLQTVLTHLREARSVSSVIPNTQETQLYHAIYAPSWHLLSVTGQQLLIAMSLFAPGVGVSLSVMTTVSGLRETEVIIGLQEGWQLSWLEIDQGEDHDPFATTKPPYYYIHPLTAHFLIWEVCQFGEQIQSPAPPEAPAGFFAIFAQCLTNALHHYLAKLDDDVALAPPVQERQSAMHLLNYALKLPACWPITSQLLVKLAPKMEQAGHRRDWLPYLMQGIEMSHLQADTATEAEMQLQAALLYQLMGDDARAAQQFTTAVTLFRLLGDQHNQARALNRLAYVARLQRRYPEAKRLVHEALGYLSTTDPERGSSHTVLGAIALDFQQWEQAIEHFRQSLHIWQAQGNQRMIARRLRDLGPALRAQKHYAEALACYEQAMRLFGEIEDYIQQAVTCTNLGVVYTEIGQPAQAIALYRQAEPIFRQTYDERQLAMLFNNLALAYQAQQQADLAQAAYHQSIAYWQSVGDIAALVTVMDGLGLLYIEQKKVEDALHILRQARSRLEESKEEMQPITNLYQQVTSHLHEVSLLQRKKLENPRRDSPADQL